MRFSRRFDRTFAQTNRLRTEGTDALLAAAREAGVRRFVAQSFASARYAREGGPVKTEDDPLDPAPVPAMRETDAAMRHLDQAVTDAGGIAPRYGGFYGAPNDGLLGPVRKRHFPIVGDGGGVSSFIHRVSRPALDHSQFETIHPFIDGNGWTGRALIHVILRRRGLAPVVVPPVSLVLATWSQHYVDGLTATRYTSDPTAQGAVDGLDSWIGLFAAATKRAVADAEVYEERVAEVQQAWRDRLGSVRANSAVDRLISALPGAPIITVQSDAAPPDARPQGLAQLACDIET